MTCEMDFARYLAAKKTVDDRALNRNVWDALTHTLPPQPLHAIEVGAGIGTMIERLVERGVLTRAHYTAIDADARNIDELKRRCAKFTPAIQIDAHAIDVFDFIAQAPEYDLLIANAFLDLVDLPSALPKLLSLLKPGGLFYFTINYDGATIFEPVIDAELDHAIEQLYHATMDRRAGGSRTGRRLFQALRGANAEISQAGSSDWVVFAGARGYAHDEAYFLHFIIETVRAALENEPTLAHDRLRDWVTQRHQQIDEGTLLYIAHQVDVVGKSSSASA